MWPLILGMFCEPARSAMLTCLKWSKICLFWGSMKEIEKSEKIVSCWYLLKCIFWTFWLVSRSIIYSNSRTFFQKYFKYYLIKATKFDLISIEIYQLHVNRAIDDEYRIEILINRLLFHESGMLSSGFIIIWYFAGTWIY